MPWIATLQTRCARFPVAGLGLRRHSVPGTRDLRPAPRDERAQQPHRAVIGPSLVYPSESERARPDGRDHIQTLSVHVQSTCGSTFSPRGGPRTGVHVRGSPCPGTWGDLCRSTPDGGKHVGLCDRHVGTCGPKGIRMRFHGAEAGGGTGWGPEALVFCGRVVGLAAGVEEGDIGGCCPRGGGNGVA